MAQSISIESGSVLIGSPVQVRVQAESAGSAATFHRVKFIVNAALSSIGEYEEFELSAPVTDAEEVDFDISDVLRTVAGKYVYSPISGSITYPYLAYTLSAYDEYMVNGILNEKVGERVYGSTMYALMGAFTDTERYLSSGTKQLTTFTRKPATGEVCGPDETLVYPAKPASAIYINSAISSGPTCHVLDLSTSDGPVSVGGRTVYVDRKAKNRLQFQFVNGLGVIESISAEVLKSVGSSGSVEKDTVTAPASFAGVSRLSVRKSGRRPILKVSTGYVTREWAAWWHNEFLGSDNFRNTLPASCWVNLEGAWIPCAALPEDDITVYDETGDEMVRIDFTVELALDGLPNPRI